MKNKKIAAVILSAAMVVTGISCSQPVYAKKVSISDKKMILKVKEKKKLKLKNTSKKVTWKLSTKKYVTIKKVKKNCIYVIGKRAGKTKITAKLGRKKYSCLVTVKKAVGKNDTKKSTEKPLVTKTPAQNIKSTITPTKQPTMTPEVIDEEEKDEISYADGVTSKMTKTKFWLNMSSKATKPLMNNDEIKNLNAKMFENKKSTYMNDIKNIQETYNGETLRNNLAKSIDTDANRSNYYANGIKVDKTTYFTDIKNNILDNKSVTETDTINYAICTKRTELKWCPTSDYIGYSATDTDNEGVNAAVAVNEPLILKMKTADGKFYYAISGNCTGWVNSADVAVCKSKEEWLDAWDVEIGNKNFLVVTTDRIVTETSFYNPDISARVLTLGCCLKLVEKKDIPARVDGRDAWHNYVVYMPVRNEEGRYVKKIALISEHSKVNVGYLPFTEESLINTAFECLGNRYGWGGSLDAMDCSYYVAQTYRCCGLSLPRNTNWQREIPVYKNIDGKSDEEKTKAIQTTHIGSPLYFQGHTMMYLGTYNGRIYVISALGSLYDAGNDEKRNVYSVAINTLDAKRANGKTWLANITGYNQFEFTDE